MGKKIFLSYTKANSEIAKIVASKLQNEGFNIFDWRDPLKRGQRFIQRIQDEIREADKFLIILSPEYLASNYCGREADFAIQRENDRNEQFVYVALVASVNAHDAGFLGAYDYFDFEEASQDEELHNLISALKRAAKIRLSKKEKPDKYQPGFQNREEELDELTSNLTKSSGGIHFWQVLAPPQIGKSWFLTRLTSDLSAGSLAWKIRRINLRKNSKRLKLRSDIGALLSAFFKVNISTPVNDEDIRKIVRKVGRSRKYWLLLLDDGELLSDETARELRQTLGQVDSYLRKRKMVRLAFVAASRRYFSYWARVLPEYPRSKTRSLSPFTINVVSETLIKMSLDDEIENETRWINDTAVILHKVTEGLPALLVRYLNWIQRKDYEFSPNALEGQILFKKITKPYIENTILSPDSLLPSEGNANRIKPQCDVLIEVLSGLCVYRRFITRYLDLWLQDNPDLQAKLEKLKWGPNDLHAALKNTYITEIISNDLWTVFYPAVRRLLFQYFYTNPSNQSKNHKKSTDFYQNHWEEWDGTDRAIVVLEYLWHEIEFQRISKRQKLPTNIKLSTEQIFSNGIKSDLYSTHEISEMIKARMDADEEFQNTLYHINRRLSTQIINLL